MDKNDKKLFKAILCKSQEELLSFCSCELEIAGYKDVVKTDRYVFAEGDTPVLVVAHCDRKLSNESYNCEDMKSSYTQKVNVKSYRGVTATFCYDQPVEVWSHPEGIAGDDRCGVYCILKAVKDGYRPYILFTTNEELSDKDEKGVTAFIRSKYINEIESMNFFVQIDRGHLTSGDEQEYNEKQKRNRFGRDLVYYNSTKNDTFKKDIENVGSNYLFYNEKSTASTDIVHLTNNTNIASVNISSGYFGEHLPTEIIVIEEVDNTYNLLCKLIEFSKDSEQYKAT